MSEPPEATTSRRPTLREFLNEMRNKKSIQTIDCVIDNDYSQAEAALETNRKRTAVAYDLETSKHKCEWDDTYPECPERLFAILDRCNELGLIRRCIKIECVIDPLPYLQTVHSGVHIETLMKICKYTNLLNFKDIASQYDAVYFNDYTFDAACRSLNNVVNLVTTVARSEKIQNGFALVRPPGHHAMRNAFCGYCFFNNVAVAAEACIKETLCKRIMIIDFDVHHGQATQQMFYNQKNVLYFSIHRYEHGTFWPNLFESNFNFIGNGEGKGYNINVPLNATGLTDSDYLAIVFNILLPVTYEYNPDLIIISAGYDAAIGCPEGQMNVTPGFYSHLITLLNNVSNGKLAVCLEGGYFRPSLSEGAAMTLKALLGDPCPRLDDIKYVSSSVIETITNVRRVLRNYWNCFSFCELLPSIESNNKHCCILRYYGKKPKPPYETSHCYPTTTKEKQKYFAKKIELLKQNYNTEFKGVSICYDKIMLLHQAEGVMEMPERPERLTEIYKLFKDSKLLNRLKSVEVLPHNIENYNVHSEHYLSNVLSNSVQNTGDVYTNQHTLAVLSYTISALISCIDILIKGTTSSCMGIVRPPGHHADYNNASGFCILNNIAFVANHLIEHHNYERVLILDFDVHHGNGTQDLFYTTNKVMYISIHRFDNGKFFPNKSTANYEYDGYGCGKGYNINIPFNDDKMGDSEYFAAFFSIILPIAYSYSPQIILVSAGFDAGINDPLGHYRISPETFGHFLQFLKPISGGKIMLVLEGGYNTTTTAYGMAMCAKVLLGDSVPMPKNVYRAPLLESACNTIRNVTNHFKQYWPILNVNQPLPSRCLFQSISNEHGDEIYQNNNFLECDFEDPELILKFQNMFSK